MATRKLTDTAERRGPASQTSETSDSGGASPLRRRKRVRTGFNAPVYAIALEVACAAAAGTGRRDRDVEWEIRLRQVGHDDALGRRSRATPSSRRSSGTGGRPEGDGMLKQDIGADDADTTEPRLIAAQRDGDSGGAQRVRRRVTARARRARGRGGGGLDGVVWERLGSIWAAHAGVGLVADTDDARDGQRGEPEVACVWPVAARDICALWVHEGERDDHGWEPSATASGFATLLRRELASVGGGERQEEGGRGG